jgi:hypothetical protein
MLQIVLGLVAHEDLVIVVVAVVAVVAVSAVSVENFVNEDCSSGGQLWFRWQNQISWLKSA